MNGDLSDGSVNWSSVRAVTIKKPKMKTYYIVVTGLNKESQTSRRYVSVYLLFLRLCGHTGVRYIRLQWSQPSYAVSQPSKWSDPNQLLITSLPSLVNQWATPRHMHNLGSQSDPPTWPMVDLVQSDRSVFILATLLCTIKVCGSNVLKVVPIQVSNVLCLF